MKAILRPLLSMLIYISSVAPLHADTLLKDTHGHTTPFTALKGKWVLINYWAEWCHTCLDEIPEFNRFYTHHKKDPVALYAVNYDNLPLAEQKKLIKAFNISYPNLLNDPAQALNLGDIRGVPVTFIFNPQGQLVKTLYGGQTAKSLDRIITSR